MLTCLGAAERLHVSECTLYRRLLRSGVISEIVVGNRSVRIDPESVDAYICGRVERIIRDGPRPVRGGRRSA